jgi:flagellar motor switch protein FliG
MSMLSRFRKQGGFSQLLTLIETCDPIKQKNLLHLVGVEDPGWAHLVKIKCLTVDRILNWPQEILMEITPHLTEKLIISLYARLRPDQKNQLTSALPNSALRILKDQMGQSVHIAEQNAAAIRLIQIVRDLENAGKIKFSNFDPALTIDPSIAA